MTNADQQDLFAVLDSDHEAILADLATAAGTSDPEDLAAACEQLIMLIVRHFVAEEQYLFPEIERFDVDGAGLVKAAREEHRRLEHELRRLEELETSAVVIRPILNSLDEELRLHIAAQARAVEPVRSLVEPERLVELGAKARGVERVGPTRPRTLHPDSAALNKVVSVISGFVDQTMDAYTHRGVDPR